MRNESKTISLSFGNIFRSFFARLEKSEPTLNSAKFQSNPIAPVAQTNENVPVNESEQETDKDGYQDIYCYLHLYWFV